MSESNGTSRGRLSGLLRLLLLARQRADQREKHRQQEEPMQHAEQDDGEPLLEESPEDVGGAGGDRHDS